MDQNGAETAEQSTSQQKVCNVIKSIVVYIWGGSGRTGSRCSQVVQVTKVNKSRTVNKVPAWRGKGARRFLYRPPSVGGQML